MAMAAASGASRTRARGRQHRDPFSKLLKLYMLGDMQRGHLVGGGPGGAR
jgi:hypothetical protein